MFGAVQGGFRPMHIKHKWYDRVKSCPNHPGGGGGRRGHSPQQSIHPCQERQGPIFRLSQCRPSRVIQNPAEQPPPPGPNHHKNVRDSSFPLLITHIKIFHFHSIVVFQQGIDTGNENHSTLFKGRYKKYTSINLHVVLSTSHVNLSVRHDKNARAY